MRDYSSILCFVRYLSDSPISLTWSGWTRGLRFFRHLPRVPHYSVNFYRHDRDSNPDRCGENQTCLPLHHRPMTTNNTGMEEMRKTFIATGTNPGEMIGIRNHHPSRIWRQRTFYFCWRGRTPNSPNFRFANVKYSRLGIAGFPVEVLQTKKLVVTTEQFLPFYIVAEMFLHVLYNGYPQ